MSAPTESQAISSPLGRRGRGSVATSERSHGHAHTSGWASLALSLGALGVVYGDIGTSPLYTVQLIFRATTQWARPRCTCTAPSR